MPETPISVEDEQNVKVIWIGIGMMVFGIILIVVIVVKWWLKS